MHKQNSKFISLPIIIVLAILISLSIVGCNKEPKTELESEAESSISTNIDIDVAEEDDSKDPENIENIKDEDGAKVDFAEVQAKKGLQNGIDVSKWQGKIDWQKVKNAGIDFAIIRIGYRAENGQLYRDGNADYNIQQAQKVGMI